MAHIKECPICKSGDAKVQLLGALDAGVQIDCPTCGAVSMAQLTAHRIVEEITARNHLSAVLSYYVRRMQGAESKRATLTEKLLDEFLKRELPTAAEQADNFVLWLGSRTSTGERLPINPQEVYAQVGANLKPGLSSVIHWLRQDNLIEAEATPGHVCLSFQGWRRYEELKKGRSLTKKAFMAMQFNNPASDQMYAQFKAAVRETGFELTRMDEQPRAGLIDDRLRVEIRTSRFVVVDLSGGNQGAYWEGGFAEGLGKPVFYSCEKAYFDKQKTHFDANHLYTVLWESAELERAAAELKNAIRATLPDEAKMIDD